MKKLGVLFLMVALVQVACAAHYISGWVEDALDGEASDGKGVVLWNPLVGQGDNMTDVVGPTGNSGVSGVYLIDCELLSGGCLIDDILSLKIFGDSYISWVVNVTVTGAGFDAVGNLSLNSPPNVSLNHPVDSGYSDSSLDFNCSFFDYDDNLVRVGLWGNWSGSWVEEDFVTSGLGDGSVVFSDSLAEGNYEWNCFAEDDLGIGRFGSGNNSFFVDTTNPGVSNVTSVTEVCGFGSVPVDCSVSDNFQVGNVTIRSSSPGSVLLNHSASYVSGNVYRANVNLNEVGNWSFECLAEDVVGNSNSSSGAVVKVGSGNAEVGFVGGVGLNATPSVEGETLNLSVNVTNSGCVGSGNFVVGFFDDGVSFENVTVFIGPEGVVGVGAEWIVDIGNSVISVYADLDDDLSEDNESNNVVNGSAYLKSWQEIYGNVSLDLVLAAGSNSMGNWSGEESFAGNVFIADSEANIEWNSLQAIGLTKLGGSSSGDFGEIDSVLGTGAYNDSVSASYASSGLDNFSVFGSDIVDVSYINSSSNGNFVTGLLWDMSDSVDLEYDSVESEDVIFVAKVNRGVVGSYGVYDYEISVPSKLRGYDSGDESNIYLYYDLR